MITKNSLRFAAILPLVALIFPGITAAQDAIHVLPSGNVGISTSSPRALFDVGGTAEDVDTLRTVFGRMYEGDNSGKGTFLGVRAYGTQLSVLGGKSFSIEHSFYGMVNSSINFYRGAGTKGGYLTFNTDSNFERMRITTGGSVGIGTDRPDYKLDVDGDIRAKGTVRDNTGYVVPKGGIIMWNGSVEDFGIDGNGKPNTAVEGWAMCDGKNGRPDLRNRFVVGAGDAYRVRETGGEAKHVLTEDEMPAHSHANGVGGGKGHETQNTGWGNSAGYACNECAVQVWSKKTGGNAAHENRPPYYALIYIMKL